MHIPTHLMSGWCIGNLFHLTGRQRVMCMVAASAADLDGLSIVGGLDAYQTYHHEVGHNLPFGVLVCVVLWWFSGKRFWPLVLYVVLFHLHLLMDFFGSGPWWPIYYFWPFSHWSLDNHNWSWAFHSWQNTTVAAAFLTWMIAIAVYCGRTPLEVLMPNLDRQLVDLARRFLGSPKHDQEQTAAGPQQ